MKFALAYLSIISLLFQCDCYTFETKHIEIPLDHYSYTDNLTFQLRYLVNDTFFKEDGAILFYTGNEGDINMFAQNTGFMFDIAPQLNALIIFAEHRYYGQSLPFGNQSYSSLENLGYLSTTQALADFAYLINFLKNSYPTIPNGKTLPVIAFGGSYGGMLSAYLRMKFPFSVIGAVASSAPIYQYPYLTECDSFTKTVTRTFDTVGGEKCSRAISKSWNVIRNFTSTQDGRNQLSKMWGFCDVLQTQNQTDTIIGWLTEIYEFLAEMNYPYYTEFLMPLPANPVKEFCNNIQEEYFDNLTLLEDLGQALQVYVNYTGAVKCINFNQSATEDLGETGWFFQTCTDQIQYLCSTDEDMFENYDFDFESYKANCRETFYGIEPRSIDVPLLEFGGKDLKSYSNILFTNGNYDPWSGLGVLQNVSQTVWAINIPTGAHHLDLRASNANDTMDVIGARAMVLNQIYNWLIDYKSNYTAVNVGVDDNNVEVEEIVVNFVK